MRKKLQEEGKKLLSCKRSLPFVKKFLQDFFSQLRRRREWCWWWCLLLWFLSQSNSEEEYRANFIDKKTWRERRAQRRRSKSRTEGRRKQRILCNALQISQPKNEGAQNLSHQIQGQAWRWVISQCSSRWRAIWHDTQSVFLKLFIKDDVRIKEGPMRGTSVQVEEESESRSSSRSSSRKLMLKKLSISLVFFVNCWVNGNSMSISTKKVIYRLEDREQEESLPRIPLCDSSLLVLIRKSYVERVTFKLVLRKGCHIYFGLSVGRDCVVSRKCVVSPKTWTKTDLLEELLEGRGDDEGRQRKANTTGICHVIKLISVDVTKHTTEKKNRWDT